MKLRQKKFFVSLVCLLSLIYLGGSAFATNIVINGSFVDGNSGFTSGYTYGNLGSAASYAIGDNAHDWNSAWGTFGPQDGDNTMMIVNGATSATKVLWSQTVMVVSNTDYDLSFWVASSHSSSPAQLRLSINGTPLGSIVASSTVGQWDEFSNTWNSGANTTALLSLFDLQTASFGNDFCLDNIRMDGPNPVPVPSTVLLLGSGLASLGFLRRKWALNK